MIYFATLKQIHISPKVTVHQLQIQNEYSKVVFTCLVAAENPNKLVDGYYLVAPYCGTKHKDCLIIWNTNLGVPKSRAILFHVGNFWYDNDGCLLTGKYAKLYKGEWVVYKSMDTFAALKEAIDYPNCTIQMKVISKDQA